MKASANRLVAIVLLVALAGTARAGVLGYTAATVGSDTVLTSVTVQRGGRAVTFDPAKRIGVQLIHFKSPDANNIATAVGAAIPAEVGELLSDGKLNTGVLNPGGQGQPLTADPVLEGPQATPGMAVVFERPVVNLPGVDVVIFELHRELNSPLGGDAFVVSPLRFAPGLRSLVVEAFDIRCDDPRALPIAAFDFYRLDRPPQSIEALNQAAKIKIGSPHDFRALAVGIDLSDLGYAEGAEVEGLFLQDKTGTGLMVDPVLIAGLPAPLPENLLAEIPRPSEPEPGAMLQTFLEGPMAGVEEIVYAERVTGFDHYYANFGFLSCSVPEYPPQRGIEGEQLPPRFGEGGRLIRYNLRTGERSVLVDDPRGGVRDPQVHYDGRTILFSYRRGGQPYHHLYEIQADGTDLVQLTDGPYDDIEPTYLPDGGIVFCSSRCNRFVSCWRTPVAVLYRCDADGGNIRPISTNAEHDNTPWMLPDGRVLFTRWEYVDRSQFHFHHLWTVNPDGTGQTAYYGNQFRGTAMLDAKPIPETNRVVVSFSPGHGVPGHMGHVTVIDPSTGPDDPAAARRISRDGKLFRDPYAFSEDCFLVVDKQGIHVMDGAGQIELVCAAPHESRLECHEPRPLVPRPREPLIPSRIDLSESTGRLFLGDVYRGRNMDGVDRGEIKKLLVMERLPKPINFSGGMWPISAGGTFQLAAVLGTVPVAADGSAYFELPALRSLFFVALDENDLAVKRMQSFVSVQPGETTGCVGCHEHRSTAPLPDTGLTAFLRPPDRIEPVAGVPDVLDFPRDIQPILDRHCVECHQPDRLEGRVDLSGDHTPLFAQSYWTILQHGLISDGRNEEGNRPPRSIGSSASRLLQLFDGSHYEAEPSPTERATLRLWIESSAVYAGTYAALGSGMAPVEFPGEVIQRRCGDCHGTPAPERGRIGRGDLYFRFGAQGPHLPLVHEFTELQQIRGSIGYYRFGDARPPQSLCNLTRPDKSLLLRAPLAPQAGGLGWCEPRVFGDTHDADYQALLAAIAAAAERHRQAKRFDMPGFRPNASYVRQMQQYGILPADLDPDAEIDFRAVDRTYWRSFWHQP